MKHLILFFTLCSLLLASCNDYGQHSPQYEHNRQELMRIREKSSHHIVITDEMGMDSLYEFFRQHGTPEDRFVASYCKAIVLHETGEKENAFNLMIATYNDRPATVTEAVRITMMRMLDYFLVNYIWDRDAPNIKKWIKEAEAPGLWDPRQAYILYQRKATYFDILQKTDSCRHYMERACDNMMEYAGWDENKSMILGEIAGWYAQRGEHDQFIRLYRVLQEHPYQQRHDATDFYAGLSYNQTGQRDSAEICFRRASHSDNPEVVRYAYIQLAIMARNAAQHDSVFAYFQGYVSACDSVLLKQQAEATQKLEAAYRIREQENKLSRQKIFILTLMVAMFVLLLCAAFGWIMFDKVRKKKAEKEVELERERELCLQLQHQLQMLLENEEKEKQNNLQVQKQQLDKYIEHLHSILDTSPKNFTESDIAVLSEHFTKAFPNFVQKISDIYPRLKKHDIALCALILYGFGHTEIGHFLHKERQHINNVMRRISKNLTGDPVGRTEHFKTLLEKYMA